MKSLPEKGRTLFFSFYATYKNNQDLKQKEKFSNKYKSPSI